MAAPAFRAASQLGEHTAGPTHTLTKPAGVVSGDVLIGGFFWEGVTDTTYLTAPSGWTLLAQTDLTSRSFAAYVKVAGGAEPANYAWTVNNDLGLGGFAGGICAYSGGDSTTPTDVARSNITDVNSAAPSSPASGTHYDNTRLVLMYVGTTTLTGYPAGTTSRVSVQTGGSPTANEAINILDLTQASAGAVAEYTAAHSGTGAFAGGFVVGLPPSGGAPKSLFNRWGAVHIAP